MLPQTAGGMNILDQIIANKKRELDELKASTSINSLEKSTYFSRTPLSLVEAVRNKEKTGIIAEFKRRSPSKGILNASAAIGPTTVGYCEAGASGLSILTDQDYFGGSNADLSESRGLHSCPILRKDFTIDEYQVLEAKSIGADAILLIAAVLETLQAQRLASFAHSLNLEVLLEVHDEAELERTAGVEADLIGVNNRNLKTFEVSTEISKRLAPLIRKDAVKVSESGISDPVVIRDLRQYGYQGFLMGETFMKNPKPEVAAREFMDKLRKVS
jgi:indole-3-glycerol phosphate synthase